MADLASYWDSRADREASREEENPRKRAHTDRLWRMVECALPPPGARILDAGGGTGRFSIPLAERGYRVVHLDVSQKMLDIASRTAAERAARAIEFVLGDVRDLSRFADASFDLVLCMDSPLSFCFTEHERALDEVTRVCRRSLVICVMSRLGVILEGGMTFDLEHFGKPHTVVEVFDAGNLVVTEELRRLQPLMPSWHAFTPEEIRALVAARGFSVDTLTGVGVLSRSVSPELLRKLFQDPDAYREYLDFEERFDAQAGALGTAACGGGGLALRATRK